MNLKPSECWTKPKIVKLSNRYTGGVIELAAKNRVAAKDPEKVAEEKKKAATDSKLLSSNPSALSEEALDAALAAAKAKLEDSGFGDRAQSVVDKLKEELQARQDEDGKQAEAEEIAKTGVADKMVQEGKADTIRKAAENRAKAHKEKAESSPEAKRMNVAKQGAEPGTAAANTLAKLPPAEKAKIKARAKLAEKAKQAKEKSPEADPAKKPDAEEPPRDEKKKDIKLSNGVNVVLDFSSVAPKGQLAFRYKHGWILINPMINSRGKFGGALARKHGVKSGTTTKGHFAKNSNGKGSKFVAESTGHPTLAQQMKDTANKLNFQMAQKKEDAALKEEVKQVKLDTAKAEYVKASEKAKQATVAALAEDEHLAKAEKHQKAYEAHSKAQTQAANLSELSGTKDDHQKATHHSDMALLHQKQVPIEKSKHAAEVQAKIDKAENEYMGQAAKAAEETSKVLAIHPDKHGELKSAHLDAAIAHGHAENLAKAAGKPELAAEHHKAMEHQKKLAKEEYAKSMADVQKKAKQQEAEAKKKAEEAKKSAETPKFQKVEAGVLVNMDDGTKEKKILPGLASPKGKLFIHKSTGEGTKGYTISSVSAGLKLPGEFKTQKEAKAAAHFAETTFPGKAFTESAVKDAKTKKPEEFQAWTAEWKKHLDEHTWPGYEKSTYTKKTHEEKMAEAKASGEKAGKEAYASLQEFKPGGQVSKPTEVKEVTEPKKLAVLDAIESLPEEEYDKAPPSAWKKYFESMYTIQTHEKGMDWNSETVKTGTEAHQTLKKNGVSDEALDTALKALFKDTAENKGTPKKDEKTYTKEDFKVTLPGPGMYADGNAISKLHDQIVKEENDAKAEAMQAAYEDALDEFKAKHGKEFNPSAVEKQSATSTFVPQLGDGGFFDAAKELGYHHPDFNEDVTEGWKPPAGTTGALKIYTGSGYSSINAQLRKYGTTGGSNDKTIASMDKAFAAAPGLSKDMVTVRRLKDDGPFPGNPPPMEPGATAIDYGYGSTSKSTDAWSGSVVLEVRIPKGTKVVDVNHNNVVSASMGEQEILLDRGAKYKVISDSKEGFQRHLVVEVVSTGHVKGED